MKIQLRRNGLVVAGLVTLLLVPFMTGCPTGQSSEFDAVYDTCNEGALAYSTDDVNTLIDIFTEDFDDGVPYEEALAEAADQCVEFWGEFSEETDSCTACYYATVDYAYGFE